MALPERCGLISISVIANLTTAFHNGSCVLVSAFTAVERDGNIRAR